MLARAGYHVLGVDISERMIEIARQRSVQEGVSAQFQVGDMETLDLSRCFDAVLFFDCLHHVPAYGKTLRRAWAHLQPGGRVLLFETTWLHRISAHGRWAERAFGVTEQGFTRAQLRRALRRAGFEQIAFHHDPGLAFRGVSGLFGTLLQACCDYALFYPRAKNIVSACKAAEPPEGDGA